MNKEYVVKKGETLWEISKKIYGTGELYHIIAKENEISNPDTIQNGQIIKIPDVEFYTEKEVLKEAEEANKYKQALLDIKEYIENEVLKYQTFCNSDDTRVVLDIVNKAIGDDRYE